MKIGRISTLQNSLQLDRPVNCHALMFGINNGLSIEKRILKIKNSQLLFSVGIWSNGIFLYTIKTKKLVSERGDIFGRDSVVIDFKRNNIFYLTPFYQLTFKTKYKKKAFIGGVKLILDHLDPGSTNINFRFFVTKGPFNPSGSYGYFADYRQQFVLFFGFAI